MKKILIIKHGSLGDIAFSLPPIVSIKNKYNDSSIHLLTEKKYISFFDKSKFFNKIIEDNRKNIFSSIFKVFKLLSEKYDIIIDLQNSQRTSLYNLFFRIFGKSIICSSRKFAQLRYIIPPQGEETATTGLYNQLRLLDIHQTDINNFDWLKVDLNNVLNKPLALFIPGVAKGSEHKQWQPEKFADVARYCESKNFLICVIGAMSDLNSSQPILNRCKNILNKIGVSPPEVIYSLALKSTLIFSNDTGPGHIASLANNNMIWIINDNIVSKANISDNNFNHKICSSYVKNIPSNQVVEYIKSKELLKQALN